MKKRVLSIVLTLAIILLMPNYNANACESNLTYKLDVPDLTELTVAVYGTEPVYNEGGTNISSAIRNGVTAWNYTGGAFVNIEFTNYAYYNNANYTVVVVFYDQDSDFAGGCMLYKSNGVRVNAGDGYPSPTQDWNYCIIRIHTNNIKVRTEGLRPVQALGAHECGHALGLRHCDTISHNSIMFNSAFEVYYYNNNYITAPTNTDRSLLFNLYSIIPNI